MKNYTNFLDYAEVKYDKSLHEAFDRLNDNTSIVEINGKDEKGKNKFGNILILFFANDSLHKHQVIGKIRNHISSGKLAYDISCPKFSTYLLTEHDPKYIIDLIDVCLFHYL